MHPRRVHEKVIFSRKKPGPFYHAVVKRPRFVVVKLLGYAAESAAIPLMKLLTSS